jgi:amino acid permease
LITIPTLITSCLIAALYDKVNDYISMMGGFCSVIIGFVMPCILYVKTSGKPVGSSYNMLVIVVMTTLSLIGFTAAVISVINTFSN